MHLPIIFLKENRMKINFQNQEYTKYDLFNENMTSAKMPEKVGKSVNAAYLDLGNRSDSIKGNAFNQDDKKAWGGKSMEELQQELGNIDVGVQQDYATVLSNTLSEEDYAKAQEEGFDYASMDGAEVVSIQDRVKAEVAKGGTTIVGYNDDLDVDVLAKAVGSEALARSLYREFASNDIPVTDENLSESKSAWDLVKNAEQPNDAKIAYMVENELAPTPWNFYLAQNSGAIEMKGEAIDLDAPQNEGLLSQVTNILFDAGYTNENIGEGLEKAQWLLDRALPVTVDSVELYDDIKSIEFPIDEEDFAKAARVAISEGVSPVYADLSKSESIIEKAIALEKEYFSDEYDEWAENNIVARRQLEEIRLSMTAEVNMKLLESNFAIDTAPIEEFIDALKEAEKQIAAKYFPEAEETSDKAVNNYRLMNETQKVIAEVKDSPLATLGMFTSRSAEEVNLIELHAEGRALRDTFEKAGESYEALMTAPRTDLGDSIRKAFGNIDSLADSMGIEKTEDNLRGMRILGYNRMELSEENLSLVTAADRVVRDIVEKMTPLSVLNMIRDGVNPLETSFAELGTYFDSQQNGGYEQASKSYSEFLYGLDMQDSITPEERESFIGIYRLLHQVESMDGAAIGAVLNEKAEIGFDTLLSAVRTRKLKGVDVSIDDEFGGRTDIIKTGISITDQISTAYRHNRYEEELAQLRTAAQVSPEAANKIEENKITNSAENLLAMEELLAEDSKLFDTLSKSDNGKRKMTEIVKKADIIFDEENFDESYENINEEMTKLSEELTMESNSYIDIKALALAHRQLHLAKMIAENNPTSDSQEYIIPMEVGDKISKVHLSFLDGEGQNSLAIKLALEEGQEVNAHFDLNGETLEGYMVGNNEDELQKLKAISDIFFEAIKENESLKGINVTPVLVARGERAGSVSHKSIRDNVRSKDAAKKESDGSERGVLLQVTKVFLQSVKSA